MSKIDVDLYGYKFSITDEQLRVMQFAASINKYRNELIKDYKKFYWNCGSIANVVDNSENYIYSGWYQMCEIVAQNLIDRGMFGITADDIYKQMCSRVSKVDHVVDDTASKIFKITEQYDKERQYREIRKASRGKVIGGGFGLKGAAKGMLTAGSINLATGAAHSVINTIGNIGSSISQSNKLNDLYRNGTLEKFVKALEEDSNKIITICDEIYTFKLREEFFFNEERAQKAKGIFIQLQAEEIPEIYTANAIAQMLYLFPFFEEYFNLAFDKLGDYNGNLTLYSKLVGLDIDYTERERKKKYYEELEKIHTEVFGYGRCNYDADERSKSIYKLYDKNNVLAEILDNDNLLFHSIQSSIAYICSFYIENTEVDSKLIFVTFEVRQKRYEKYYELIQDYLCNGEVPLLLIINSKTMKFDLITTQRVISPPKSIEILMVYNLDVSLLFGFYMHNRAWCEELVQAVLIYLQCLKTRGNGEKIPGLGGNVSEGVDIPVSEKIDSEIFMTAPTIEEFVYLTYQKDKQYNCIYSQYYADKESDPDKRMKTQKYMEEIIEKYCVPMEENEKIIFLALCGLDYKGLVFTDKSVYIFSKNEIRERIYYKDILDFQVSSSKLFINNTTIVMKITEGTIPWSEWLKVNFWKIVNYFLIQQSNAEDNQLVKTEKPKICDGKIAHGSEMYSIFESDIGLELAACEMLEKFNKSLGGNVSAMEEVVQMEEIGIPFPVENILVDTFVDDKKKLLNEQKTKFYSEVFTSKIQRKILSSQVLIKECEYLFLIHGIIAKYSKGDVFYVKRHKVPNEIKKYGDLLDKRILRASSWNEKKYDIYINENINNSQVNEKKELISGKKLFVILTSGIEENWIYLNIYFYVEEDVARRVEKNRPLILYAGYDIAKAFHYFYICKTYDLSVSIKYEDKILSDYLNLDEIRSSAMHNEITKKAIESETMFCTNCGKKILRTCKFCNYCGSQITYKARS